MINYINISLMVASTYSGLIQIEYCDEESFVPELEMLLARNSVDAKNPATIRTDNTHVMAEGINNGVYTK